MSTAFRIEMNGSQEVPPVVTSASGLGTAVYDSKAGTLAYTIYVTGVDFGPLLGQAPQTPDPGDDVNGDHFHSGARGAEGPVVLDWFAQDDDFTVTLQPDGSWKVEGLWEASDPSGTPLSQFVDALANGTVGADIPLYANIHTGEFSGGEIRGQLVGLSTDNGETITGAPASDILPGLGGDDMIFGLDGNDIIDGGKGDDSLEGGAGNDTFVFSTKLDKKTNVDDIGDFVVGEDIFHLDSDIFEKLKEGELKDKAFREGNKARDGNDRIIYNEDNGKLYYDKNGDDGGGKVQFARLDSGFDLSASDFFVI